MKILQQSMAERNSPRKQRSPQKPAPANIFDEVPKVVVNPAEEQKKLEAPKVEKMVSFLYVYLSVAVWPTYINPGSGIYRTDHKKARPALAAKRASTREDEERGKAHQTGTQSEWDRQHNHQWIEACLEDH